MAKLTKKELQKLAKRGLEGAAAGKALRIALWNAATGEFVFPCPVCGEQWNAKERPDIKARIQRRGNCPNCEDREEDK